MLLWHTFYIPRRLPWENFYVVKWGFCFVFLLVLKTYGWDWGCSLVVQFFTSTCGALGCIPKHRKSKVWGWVWWLNLFFQLVISDIFSDIWAISNLFHLEVFAVIQLSLGIGFYFIFVFKVAYLKLWFGPSV